MPELPEVETITAQLNQVLKGKVFSKISVLRDKSAQSDLKGLKGRKIKKVGRLAKHIKIEFLDKKTILLIHLKMTGQLVYQPKKGRRLVGGHPTEDWVNELPSSHTRIVANFTDGSTLYFNDQRVFGWWRVVDKGELRRMVDKLPPDVVDDEFTVGYLNKVLSKSGRPVKLVILDQQKMGGMGNIYANDALWMAGINPKKKANTLNKKEIRKLHKAMRKVLEKGILLGGASISDYIQISGQGGGYQEVIKVYDKAGEKCGRRNCSGVIVKEKLGGRGTYYCSVCQT